MGTKHGYTEKRCNVCGVVKPREAFPKRGGLACTECQRPQLRKEDRDRYEKKKHDPKYVQYHRDKAKEHYWKKKREREEAMTEPPETPDEDPVDWEQIERDAARGFVEDSTPDMQEAIDRARAEYGEERLEEMVQEVIRRANRDDDEEQMNVLDDDELLDAIEAGTAGPDELADMLGAWRDDVESVPPSPGTAPEVVQEIHDFTEEIERATSPSRPTEGGPTPMSISEQAAQVAQIGNDQAAMAGVQNAAVTLSESAQVGVPDTGVTAALADTVERLSADKGAAANLLGESEGAQQVAGAGGNASEHVEAALAAALKAKELGEQYAAAIQTANSAVSGAREAVQLFYRTVSEAAQRHGG